MGKFDCAIDNASCFFGSTFLADGTILLFGDLPVYVSTVPERFPREIVSFVEPQPSADSTFVAPLGVEVMMAGSSHQRRPALECIMEEGGISAPLREKDPVERAIDELLTPVEPGDDPAEATSKVEAARESFLKEARGLASAKHQMESTMREYHCTHGFTPASNEPSRQGHVQRHGGELVARLERDGEPVRPPYLARPTYNTPIKNLRAARAAADVFPNLESEARIRQDYWVRTSKLTPSGRRKTAATAPGETVRLEAAGENLARPSSTLLTGASLTSTVAIQATRASRVTTKVR